MAAARMNRLFEPEPEPSRSAESARRMEGYV
jgi:hypothetical protein